MVRETRHLWVGNLPENIREEKIREHFKRYGRVQSVKLLSRSGSKDGISSSSIGGSTTSENTLACTVAFMDIKSASKAHTAEHKLDERTLTTEYYEPAAIPSAAAPQTPEPPPGVRGGGTGGGTPSSATNVAAVQGYTPTNSTPRFPNSHGPSEEHPNFSERFYERGSGRVADAEYLRRPGYHETSRGRARDRLYRNGPYPSATLDRHRTTIGSWPYEGSSTRYATPSDPGYVNSTPVVEPVERRISSDAQIIKKKTKSRSGSRTPSPSGSTSSRSPSRSRSRSSSSSSSSTTSRGSSSPTSSPRTRRVQSSVSTAPPVHSEDRRPLAICVRNLPARSSDTSLKDGLFHEYKKHGKVTWVKVVGQSSDRYALVCFKKPDDVEKALEVSYDKLFFGCKIEVGPYQGYDVEDNEFRPYEAELDEYHPKATRTLFIGNLEKDVTASDLRKHFDQFGEIIEIDIKKQGAVSSYAFCQYSDIESVVKAIRKMDGEHLGNNRIKLGFGKSMPTNCVWVDGVSDRVDEKYITSQFERYGQVTQVSIDRDRGHALIFFDQVSCAQTAVKEMRGVTLRSKKLQVDFASRECQDTFFDHLEKQGAGSERPVFDPVRDTIQRERTFESSTLAATTRYTTRYETPSRPRTSSYSSRSGTGSQCTGSSAVPSPGTPGSVTPRGTGSRSRLTRYTAEYYEPGVEYPERRFLSYDEFSQGSGASHEDLYEHEYIYNRESPGHVETTELRTIQSVVVATDLQITGTPFVPPDIRHLQKERVHLLEQLDECPSSGDELMSPKKRLKLDLCDSAVSSDLVIEHDHRKLIEVRRLSDTGVKHHSRRPSIDGKHCIREIPVERSYIPHAVCKRRKTSGSESDRTRIHHHHEMSGSESLAGSRPGTPLCDERPENLPPSEPRRLPRERNANEGPLSLPLPRFAAQVLNSPRLNVSVAGFKGSKENIVSSPPTESPKVTVNPVPPSPVHVPPPASPPPRPPSSSSDSDATPPSPSLEERLRSLDEKYEKWSGSRALSAAGGDALAKLDASASERFRLRHKLLDLDLKELQPSEIVKSVLAKRSVFDEDSKRLENVGEKYEPKEFPACSRSFVTLQSNIGVTPCASSTSPSLISSTKSLTNTCAKQQSPPRAVTVATALPAPAAKGLQYPFPSHPPVLNPSSPAATSPRVVAPSTSQIHSDNQRLKLCGNLTVSCDRTTSKVNLNRSVNTKKQLDNSDKIITNIPIINSENVVHQSTIIEPVVKTQRKEDKVAYRRDSVNSSSPNSAVSNSGSSSSSNSSKCKERTGECDKKRDKSNELEKKMEDDRLREKELLERERIERLEQDRIEKERLEKERIEKERLEREHQEKERLEKERLDKERIEKERLDKERLEKERLEKELLEKEHLEKERLERERLERERLERERLEREQLERERLEKERLDREKLERDRKEKEKRDKEDHDKRDRIKDRDEHERRRDHDRRHKEDNHHDSKETKEKSDKPRNHSENTIQQTKHLRDNHIDSKTNDRHRENHKENKDHDSRLKETQDLRNNHVCSRKDLHDRKEYLNDSRRDDRSHCTELRKEEKIRHHSDRDSTEFKRKEIKEIRENNSHEKIRHFSVENSKERHSTESRHLSSDSDKNKYETPNKKKENKVITTPASVGCKRRVSSQDSESPDEVKRLKINSEHRKIERRDSKDSRDSNNSRSSDKQKMKHNKNNFTKMLEDKIREEKRSKELYDEKRKEKDRDRDRDERYKLKQTQKLDRQKLKSKNRDSKDYSTNKDGPNTLKTKPELMSDKDFLARLDLRATEDDEKQKLQRKEKEKRHDIEDRRSSDENKRTDERKKLLDKKRDEIMKNCDEKNKLHQVKKECQRIRKITNSSDTSDSDEPKKHSIFDIIDDEPAYISMYDKVKARSCKNMQKQEEEKRQEKLKAKFTQLKQSRAKREEKKRSTSWDEDSDSDHIDTGHDSQKQNRRAHKMLITSSSEDEIHSLNKARKKSEMYTDSDSDRKHERLNDSTDDEHAHTKTSRKGSRSRITSDTSEDELLRKRYDKIKKEHYSDSEIDQGFADSDEKTDKHYKKSKEEIKLNNYEEDKYIKKEKKLVPKLQNLSDDDESARKLLTEQVKTEIFGTEIQYNDRLSMICDISSDNDNDIKNNLFGDDKIEMRKKNKKKQKRQKNSLLSEDAIKIERMIDDVENESGNHVIEESKSEKRKHNNKKDKKREKIKDDERQKDKKKVKKCSKSEFNVLKREGKLEDIFGSFSDDSETGNKESLMAVGNKENNSFFVHLSDKLQSSQHMYTSDSDQHIDPEKEKLKEESRKRKEKKRKEKERRLREENDNSIDFADLGKVLEDNLKEEVVEITEKQIKTEIIEEKIQETTPEGDVFRFSEGDDDKDTIDRKEHRERKKKRKKSKEEKRYYHDKLEKVKSPTEIKTESLSSANEIKTEDAKQSIQPQLQQIESTSLPNILDIPSPPQQTQNQPQLKTELSVSPLLREPIITPIPKTPSTLKSEKKRDKFIPGFGTEIDEKIHENAVKSISETLERLEPENIKTSEEAPKSEKPETVEDKPRVIISQEETEDAVAALLGESFGGGDFEVCYNEPSPTPAETNPETSTDAIVEDDEEMRQAVQSLNSSDLEVKPDTPQSENDLQIDTDTDEGEESVVRYEQSPRTPEMVDLSRPPKTPDYPANYYRPERATDEMKSIIKATERPVARKDELINAANEIRRNLDVTLDKPARLSSMRKTPQLLQEQQRSVISQSWTSIISKSEKVEKVPDEIIKKESEDTKISLASSQVSTVVSKNQVKSFIVPPIIKIPDHTTELTTVKTFNNLKTPKITTTIPPALTTVKPRTLPQQIPASVAKPLRVQHAVISHLLVASTKSQTSSTSVTAVVTSQTNRLPIQTMITPKPLQSTTIILPQASKITAIQNIQKIVSTSSEIVTKYEPPRMVYSSNMNVQSNIVPSNINVPSNNIIPSSMNVASNIVTSNVNVSSNISVPNKIVPSNIVSSNSNVLNNMNVPNNMTVPSYSYPHTLVHHTQSSTSQNQNQLPSVHIPVRNIQPARHILPPTTYALPTSRSVSPVVKETPKSVIEKTIPASNHPVLHTVYSVKETKPLTAVIQEVSASKLIPLATVASDVRNTQLSIIQQAPSISKPIITTPPVIIVSKPLNVVSPVSSVVSTAHLSQLPPLIVTQSVNVTAKLVVPSVNSQIISHTSSPQVVISHSSQKTSETNLEVCETKVIKEIARSTPSPVIVSTPPKEVSPVPSKEPTKEIIISPDIKIAPTKLETTVKIQEIDSSYDDTPSKLFIPIETEVKSECINKEETKEVNEPQIISSKSIDTVSVIKETHTDESEIIFPEQNILKTELALKNDPLDTKEDSDYWSAKEVNIESVIKKVDALCSADELSEITEIGKEDWFDQDTKPTKPELDKNSSDVVKTDAESENLDESVENINNLDNSKILENPENLENSENLDNSVNAEEKDVSARTNRRGGRLRGGRKNTKTDRLGVTTRRGKSATPSRRGSRGSGRTRNDKKIKTSESDIYEFHDDSDESKDRPRLILTIKSPASAVIKEGPKVSELPHQPLQEFVSPAANTRKSRRIQERDGSRNTVDDIIEDVVKNVAVVTRSITAQGLQSPRRSTRQNAPKVQQVTEPRKSPRASRRKDRRVSENTDESSDEKSNKKEETLEESLQECQKEVPQKEIIKVPPKQQEKEKAKTEQICVPPLGLKANLIRRVKSEEPMTLIDPVTGLLTQMRECEEGKYIPVSTTTGSLADATFVITKPPTGVQQKPQSLKAHVLSSQAAKVVVSQQQPTFISKPQTTLAKSPPQVSVNVSVPTSTQHEINQPRVHQTIKTVPVSPMSPNHGGTIQNPKQHFLQAINKVTPKPSTPINPKTHLLNAVNQSLPIISPTIVNATISHTGLKSHGPSTASLLTPVKQQVIGNVAPIVKPHNLHVPQQILTGAVASPPLKHHIAQQPIVAGASSGRISIPNSSPMSGINAKGSLDSQKVEVSMAGCVMITHPTISPQGQARGQVLQAGMPVPGYEASLHGDHPMFTHQSPPPAHQQTSPATQGEQMSHFPPGAVPLRSPHDLPPHHFMHSHVYQQYLRAQQDTRIPYHLPRSPIVSGGLEKTKDGQEGEEAPVTSPPLELRRPGSVGLTGKLTPVSHSLQSPHDRATDSPQVAQVYMHQARMPHYHTPNRYYETPTEPPPAHRPVTSHPTLTGPGSSLGAAGNLTGAMARHTGAEAPASQRGLQVATPPHASQVPPQADSLLMLLKQYRIMWQGLLALKNDQAAVQMHFVFGNPHVARNSLPCNSDGSTPPLRIAQRMRLEKTQVEGVARKMQMENEHCVLLALPCGRDHMDVLQQSTNLSNGFITYLQQKEAAGIVNIAAPGSQHAAYVVHIFPSCDFVKENLARIAPNLLHRVADIAHLLIVIATV